MFGPYVVGGIIYDAFTLQTNMSALFLELGFVLLAVALFWFSRILGELLEIIQKPPVEGLVRLSGWLLIFTFSIPHYITNAIIYPNLTANQDNWLWLWSFRTFSFVGVLAAAILAFIPAVSYWRWTRE
jgi:hypothetical protein